MDSTELIQRIQDFLETHYYSELLTNVQKGKTSLTVDFELLAKDDPEVADLALDQPEEILKGTEVVIKNIDLDSSKCTIRFSNLPKTQQTLIKDIRSNHINKLLSIKGIVRQKSDVRPQITSAKFECPSCGNILHIIQADAAFKEPSRCGCGRKGKFIQISKELVDAQNIVLEEDPEDLDGGSQPKRMKVFLKDDLVSPLSERNTAPGAKINIVGIIKEIPITLRTGGKSTRFDLLIDANSIQAIEETFSELIISPEEEQKIKELGKDPQLRQKLVGSIAPSIYGYEQIKEAVLLQLFGGTHKQRRDGSTTRGDMHILLVGDPGSGKSQILKRINVVAPKARYVSGKGVSAAGLTAAVVRDEFLQGWSLEAGAMVLASNGICLIDELDKMSTEDSAAMHEALENQTVSISKANIQATLIARTTVLAAANPKFGRFDPFEILAKQINLPPALLNRFDLIFPIKDLPEETKDTQLAKHILSLHQDPDQFTAELSTNFLKKYIAYAKQHIHPRLTTEAMTEMQRYFVEIRNKGGVEEGVLRAIPISARQLDALVRLSEAAARMRLSNTVEVQDSQKAIELLEYSLRQVGLDPETGKIDIDRIATGISTSQRSLTRVIKDIIIGLEGKGSSAIPFEDIIEAAKEKNITKEKVEEVIEMLRRSGDVFEPRRGFLQRM
ncbi:MAG TPA: minichromosome maintenance protein MCM [Candidatus Nanoarchaeia archaeon]|nr:minichromosome maintenance protein MCM [Candidatus Nanoarchaeia archaeon]